jgi:hypothetical protein
MRGGCFAAIVAEMSFLALSGERSRASAPSA